MSELEIAATEEIPTEINLDVPSENTEAKEPVETKEPSETKEEKELSLAEKIEKKAASTTPKEITSAPTEEAYKPNVKYKVMDKEFEIPKQFHSLMKDAESEKMVRELYEKAGGLDVVKTKLADTRTERDKFQQESTQIKASIDGLRSVYQSAMQTGNLLKLDTFFERLKIPEQVIMQYALAKVNFAELPAEQRQLIQSQMQSEKQAEMLATQNQQYQQQVAAQMQATKAVQMEAALARADISPIAEAFDTRQGKPGAFREIVRQHGEYRWNQGTDLTPDQAAQEVIRIYGLQAVANAQSAVAPQGNQTDASGQPSGKKVVQRTTATIPNIQGRSGASPLKGKPKSIEDLKTLAKHAAEQSA